MRDCTAPAAMTTTDYRGDHGSCGHHARNGLECATDRKLALLDDWLLSVADWRMFFLVGITACDSASMFFVMIHQLKPKWHILLQ